MSLFLMAVICYCVGILTFFLPKSMEGAAHYLANTLSLVGSAAVAIETGRQIFFGAAFEAIKWGPYSLQCDAWSAIFLLITGIAGVITSIYALGYAKGYKGSRLRQLGANWNLFILSMVMVLLSGDAFSFLVFWEIMAVASFLLVNHESEKRETWNAAYQYLVMTSLGTAFIMISFLLIGAGSESFAFADMAKTTLDDKWKHAAFMAAFLGFALKAGLVPLHIWLPNAHPAAPSHVSALMSGVMLKIALYGFGRVMFNFLPDWHYWWAVVVLIAGVVSAFLGVLYAQMEIDIKRVLAYSSVENMGVIFAAFGCGMLLKLTASGSWYVIGFIAALLHAFNHSIMKVLMFMSAGSIMHATGSKNLELFGGMAKKMPATACFTFVGSMALSALPLTNGFTGEWMVLQSFVSLAHASSAQDIRLICAFAFILLGFTGALALGCFVRFYGITFLGRARSEIAEHAHESDNFMLIAMCISSVLVLATGIYPIPVLHAVCSAIDVPESLFVNGFGIFWDGSGAFISFSPVILLAVLAGVGFVVFLFVSSSKVYVQEDVTWNCGTYPTARQQYSATGFSKPVRRAFDYMLKPKRQVTYSHESNSYFGRQLSYKLELPDMITEKLYNPLQKRFIGISAFLRRLQKGSVRLYVGYVMAAMVVVLVWGAINK